MSTTILITEPQRAVLNVFFDDMATGSPGLRRAMLEAALKVKNDHIVGHIARLPVAQSTAADVRRAIKDQTSQILALCSP